MLAKLLGQIWSGNINLFIVVQKNCEISLKPSENPFLFREQRSNVMEKGCLYNCRGQKSQWSSFYFMRVL